MFPCAEMVAFGKNGSDAVTAAVRLARAVTGRNTILQYGGHGFHDWYVAMLGIPGVPKALGELVRPFPYNDLEALETLVTVAGMAVELLSRAVPKKAAEEVREEAAAPAHAEEAQPSYEPASEYAQPPASEVEPSYSAADTVQSYEPVPVEPQSFVEAVPVEERNPHDC